MSETEYITQEKYEDIKKELADLKKRGRDAIKERLSFAKSLGDLKENAEYHAARGDQAKLEGRIEHLEHIMKTATIIEKGSSDTVELGASVDVTRGDDPTVHTFAIVGPEEADMAKQKLSYKSPIGEALMGKGVGDVVDVTTPGGVTKYTIKGIS